MSGRYLFYICTYSYIYGPVGRPRTWLESVEADMVEFEIDKEDVHDRKKWRLLSVYSPFSDRAGLPLHKILLPFFPVMDIFSVDLMSCPIFSNHVLLYKFMLILTI